MASEAYAQVYSSFPWHPKLYEIPEVDRLAAAGYFTALLVFCQLHRTDGYITMPQLVAVFPCSEQQREHMVRALVDAGLVELHGGVHIHDYLDWNRSRAQIEAGREGMSNGGKHSPKRPHKRASEATLPSSPEQSKSGVEPSTSGDEPSVVEESGEACDWCRGSGSDADGGTCPSCDGSGLKSAVPA